jgi:hypothetical protein
MIKLIVMENLVLIAQIEEVGSELGEPDCKLINPFCVNADNGTLSPWLSQYSSQGDFMIHSDKILTIAEPNTKLLERYQKVTDE